MSIKYLQITSLRCIKIIKYITYAHKSTRDSGKTARGPATFKHDESQES